MRVFAVVALAALGFFFTQSASASVVDITYTFNQDGCSGGCGVSPANYGTVHITGDTTTESTLGLTVDVNLSPGQFHSNPNDLSFVFDVTGTGLAVSISPTTSAFTNLGAGSYTEPGFGIFNWAIDSTASNQHGGLGGQELKFTLTDTSGLITFGSTHSSYGDVTFVADYAAGANGPTGHVGATLTPSVPEISTWAMLVLGFAGLGLIAYRSKKNTTHFA